MIFIRKSRPDTRIVRWTGLTLRELMIVVAVVGLLAAIALPTFVKARDKTRLNVIWHNPREIDTAKDQWAVERNKGAGASVSDLSELSACLRRGKANDVNRENSLPHPFGTRPEAALPKGVGLGQYAAGGLIPAP